MSATVNISNTILEPKQEIQMLGVQLDTKLKWRYKMGDDGGPDDIRDYDVVV